MLKRASVATEIAVCISLTVLVLFAAMAIYSDSIATLIDSSKFGKSIVKPTTTMSKEDVMRSEIEFIKTAAAQGRQALKDEALAYLNDILEGKDLHGVDSTDPKERALAERALAKELTKLALACGTITQASCEGTTPSTLKESVSDIVSDFKAKYGYDIVIRDKSTYTLSNSYSWGSRDSTVCADFDDCKFQDDPDAERKAIIRILTSLSVFN